MISVVTIRDLKTGLILVPWHLQKVTFLWESFLKIILTASQSISREALVGAKGRFWRLFSTFLRRWVIMICLIRIRLVAVDIGISPIDFIDGWFLLLDEYIGIDFRFLFFRAQIAMSNCVEDAINIWFMIFLIRGDFSVFFFGISLVRFICVDWGLILS